jgi:ribulose-5-phosphate 4-epimerase/fuculose-1-phosphate aldolase
MRFALAPRGEAWRQPWLAHMALGLEAELTARGHIRAEDPEEADLVLYAVDVERPRPFRRRHRAVFVVGFGEADPGTGQEAIRRAYPVLVRSLSNLLVLGRQDGHGIFAHMLTPELGSYRVEGKPHEPAFFRAVYERLAPLATSHLVIDNVFDEDLPPELWHGTPVTEAMREASRTLDRWGLFPAPYPIQELLPPEDYRHVRHVFGIGGLSYGNLSARHDHMSFWMTASGVHKGRIGTVSRDILLVKGFDPQIQAMRLSVAPGSRPLRVSVDAVEHWQVYQSIPEIGAMVHVHAWVEGIPSTQVNYPCGTVEMGQAMTALLLADPHPERTIVGLRNHGITATGPDFADILSRLEGRVLPQVPMV